MASAAKAVARPGFKPYIFSISGLRMQAEIIIILALTGLTQGRPGQRTIKKRLPQPNPAAAGAACNHVINPVMLEISSRPLKSQGRLI